MISCSPDRYLHARRSESSRMSVALGRGLNQMALAPLRSTG